MSTDGGPDVVTGQAFRALIERRRNRAIKAILRTKEGLVDGCVAEADAEALRRVVLEEINDLAEVALTLLSSLEQRLDDGAVYNQLWFDKLDEIHAATVGDVPRPGMRSKENAHGGLS